MDYLTEKELADKLRMSPAGLRRWRELGKGPKVTYLGGRLVRYSVEDVEAWLVEQRKEAK
jgi:predicted DNA-binding transcriptional regulator AlpA